MEKLGNSLHLDKFLTLKNAKYVYSLHLIEILY